MAGKNADRLLEREPLGFKPPAFFRVRQAHSPRTRDLAEKIMADIAVFLIVFIKRQELPQGLNDKARLFFHFPEK